MRARASCGITGLCALLAALPACKSKPHEEGRVLVPISMDEVGKNVTLPRYNLELDTDCTSSLLSDYGDDGYGLSCNDFPESEAKSQSKIEDVMVALTPPELPKTLPEVEARFREAFADDAAEWRTRILDDGFLISFRQPDAQTSFVYRTIGNKRYQCQASGDKKLFWKRGEDACLSLRSAIP